MYKKYYIGLIGFILLEIIATIIAVICFVIDTSVRKIYLLLFINVHDRGR